MDTSSQGHWPAQLPLKSVFAISRFTHDLHCTDLDACYIRPECPTGCTRLGASPGYLEALTERNVAIFSDGVSKIVANGIIEKDEWLQASDDMVGATGFDAPNSPLHES
jgi:hypothetical protein